MNPDIDTDVQRFKSANTFHVEDYSEIVADALGPLVEESVAISRRRSPRTARKPLKWVPDLLGVRIPKERNSSNHSRIPSPSDYLGASHWLNFGVRFSWKALMPSLASG